MELLYFFLGAACAVIIGLLAYSRFLPSNQASRAAQSHVQDAAEVILLGGDFKLVTCTTELILVPAAAHAQEFLNRSPDAAAPYYRAIIVERDNRLKFAAHCLMAGLAIAFQDKPAA